jgi:hypothetical protein
MSSSDSNHGPDCDMLIYIWALRATVLMTDLLGTPDGFFNHVRRYTASVVTSVTYGFRGATFESFWAHVGVIHPHRTILMLT